MLEPDEETEGTGTFEAARRPPPKQPQARRAHRRRAPSRCSTRAGTTHSVGPGRDPWSGGTTTSGSRNSPTTRGQSLQEHLLWQLELREPRAARAGDRARDRRRHQRRRLPHRVARGDRADAAPGDRVPAAEEVERVLDVRAGARSARGRRPLGGRVHRAAAAAAGSGDARPRHRASTIARHHLELVAERELSLLRRELRATRGGAGERAGAGALLPSAARARR